MSKYRIGSLFAVRVAGVPMEVLDVVRTPKTVASVRSAAAARQELQAAARSLLDAIKSLEADEVVKDRARKKIRQRALVADATELRPIAPTIERYHDALAESERRDAAETELAAEERRIAYERIQVAAEQHLPGFAPFSSAGLSESLRCVERSGVKKDDARTLLQYLQRVAAKNDTISAYGPSSWGVIDNTRRGISIDPEPGISRRTVFFERWVIERLTDAMNADERALLETAPRIHGGVRLEGARAIVFATGIEHDLSVLDQAVLERCNGRIRPSTFTAEERAALASLVSRGVVIWRIETPALDPYGFDVLVDDVAMWDEGPAKDRFSTLLGALAGLKARFAEAPDARLEVIEQTTGVLRSAGIELPQTSRKLYAATNVFGEECVRVTHTVVGADITEQLTTDAAPWYDLWQDVHAYISGQVAHRLLEAVNLDRPMPFPEYLRRCREAGFDLCKDALPRLAAGVFATIQSSWTRSLAASVPDTHRWTLTADDLAFVRRNFPATRIPDNSHPSIDVQIVAPSMESTRRGEFEVLLSELHAGVALLQHGITWACPDRATLASTMSRATGGVPIAYYGQVGAFLSCHTAVQFAHFLPAQLVYLAEQRPDPSVRPIRSSDVEVHRCDGPDIRLRTLQGADLGTITRTWATSQGSHPFTFPWGPHSPRLYVGRVIVQRESWTIRRDELSTVGSPVAVVDALRAAKGWPRFVFVRVAGSVLHRAGNTGRDKDVKPWFVDLESAMSIETLLHHLRKYEALDVAEMLPTLEQNPWLEHDGHRSFELRMMVEPG